MDYSLKVITKNESCQQQNKEAYFMSSSLVDHPEESHRCPSCPAALSSLKLLTYHLRSHHSPRGTHSSGEEDYTCGVCHKVLSSASSLDRHLLVHSGERPFKCQHCEMAFTTNGNMNRHLRTAHGVQSLRSSIDSETSNVLEKSTKRRRVEQNNNNEVVERNSSEPVKEYECPSSTVIIRNSLGSTDQLETQYNHETTRTGFESNNNENIAIRKCQICHRQDFASMALLEAHLQHNHPEVQPKCEICDIVFKDHRVSHHHWFLRHFLKKTVTSIVRNFRNSLSPPNDLSFFISSIIDFSSNTDLFSEESLPMASSETNPIFQCSKCSCKFPCVTTLQAAQEAHEPNCEISNSENRSQSENQSQKAEFLDNLNLQKGADHLNGKTTKDPYDFQNSSIATSDLIPQDILRSSTETPDNFMKIDSNVRTSSSSGASSSSSSVYQEEVQDPFAADFRIMKFKGEFPCRLCTETFSNLRALKSHNSVHMNVDPGVSYFCNICPYTNTEKVGLIKHLRSHKGARPFECSVCNYAFTTKANCERHIRSIHPSLTREEMKNALIYHPNEDLAIDPTECESAVPFVKKDARKTLVYTNIHDEPILQYYHHSTLPAVPSELNAEIQGIKNLKLLQPEVLSLVAVNNYEKPEIFSRRTNLEFVKRRRWSEEPKQSQEVARGPTYFRDNRNFISSCSSVSLVSEIKSEQHKRTEDGPINLKITPGHSVNVHDSEVNDVPLDLTKKSMSNDIKQLGLSTLSVSNSVDIPSANFPLNGDLINTTHARYPQNFLGSLQPSACSMYSGFDTISLKYGRILPDYQNPHLMRINSAARNRVQTEFVPNLKKINGNGRSEPSEITSNIFQVQDLLAGPNANRNNDSNPIFSPSSNNFVEPEEDRENSITPKSLKKAAKNRVLTQKRKQARYRIEKPFECEYCSVRFTLKNNMDRHIKHQHPEYRNKGSRKSHSTRGPSKTRHHDDIKSETNLCLSI
ncbi:ras-responsive element-binding protein 1-like isoform X2 [Cephus cinctus]|uniref:Ras-responsive element-binding protein 1-like isoform X2 n=1 Tax=Cephus cinctus TaxID=211228 RepID=A0AAJ7BL51_CEPCN|nr:ras-responsive element-binding protein 1-like isoform X2 [Cephus cinctus]XP_015588749.1 ras-responsive element-binding protein 1-like isoform X2 [Cephus cinctus]XP_024937741.1 ras-responsive element-binding protein 1-like isoform X2 [Cephus cinctus]XP_024937742.1 ras-responsive element-binding protein 1-like isoform X2 [Cephus cinctus]